MANLEQLDIRERSCCYLQSCQSLPLFSMYYQQRSVPNHREGELTLNLQGEDALQTLSDKDVPFLFGVLFHQPWYVVHVVELRGGIEVLKRHSYSYR